MQMVSLSSRSLSSTNLNAHQFITPEIKQTRVYQDAKAEGIEQGLERGKLEQKLAMIPLLQKLGLTISQIAQRLEIEEELVRVKTFSKSIISS
jgi:predicted transposase/invertase (TIGR01784 family)